MLARGTRNKPWILVEMRHGLFARFYPPSTLWRPRHGNGNSNDETTGNSDDSATTIPVHIGDLVLCRTGRGTYQTGVIHGGVSTGSRFLLPYSFELDAARNGDQVVDDAESRNSRMRSLNPHAFPRSGSDIVAILQSDDHSVMPQEQVWEASEAEPSVPQEMALRDGGIDTARRNQDEVETELLAMFRTELTLHEVRSVRAVAAVCDLSFRRVTFFYVEPDQYISIEADFKEILSARVNELFRQRSLQEGDVSVFMTKKEPINQISSGSGSGGGSRDGDADVTITGPCGIRAHAGSAGLLRRAGGRGGGPKNSIESLMMWPRQLAWPAPARHRLSTAGGGAAVVRHLIRCAALQPPEIASPDVQISLRRATRRHCDVKSATTVQLQQAALCSTLFGNWRGALELLGTASSSSRAPSSSSSSSSFSSSCRELVALHLVARSPELLKKSGTGASAADFNTAVTCAVSTTTSQKQAIDFLEHSILCGGAMEYTSVTPRAHQVRELADDDDADDADGDAADGDGAGDNSGRAQSWRVQSTAVVEKLPSPAALAAAETSEMTSAEAQSLVSRHQRTAQLLDLWKTNDPRADVDRVRHSQLPQKLRTHEDRVKMMAAARVPYDARYIAPEGVMDDIGHALDLPKKKWLLRNESGYDSVDDDDDDDDSPVALNEIDQALLMQKLDEHAAVRRLVFEASLAVARRAPSAPVVSDSDSESASSKILRLRGAYVRNFHRELPLPAMLDWAALCRDNGAWCDAMKVLVGSIRGVMADAVARNALVECADTTLNQCADPNAVPVQRTKRALAMLAGDGDAVRGGAVALKDVPAARALAAIGVLYENCEE